MSVLVTPAHSLGNYRQGGSTLYFRFNTHDAAGVPATLSGSPELKVMRGGDTTGFTTGVTFTVDFGSVTGLNYVQIDTGGGDWSGGADTFEFVITAGTVDGNDVSGTVVGRLTLDLEPADVRRWNGEDVATPTVSGVPKVDVTHLLGQDLSANNATLFLKQLDISNTDADAIVVNATGAGRGLAITGGSDAGISAVEIFAPGTPGGHAVRLITTGGDGINLTDVNHGVGIRGTCYLMKFDPNDGGLFGIPGFGPPPPGQ